MPKYIAIGSYSNASWARMMQRPDDRIAMARILAESLGGSLECIYWEVSARAAYAIAELPDSASAAALTAAVTQTGAFKNVEMHELLTQDQLSGVLAIAEDVSKVYHVPGQASDAAI